MDDRFRRRVLARAAWLGIRSQQQQLAVLLGMDESTLSRALRAENPRRRTVERIAAALGLTADELLGENDDVVVRPHPGVADPTADPVPQISRWLETKALDDLRKHVVTSDPVPSVPRGSVADFAAALEAKLDALEKPKERP